MKRNVISVVAGFALLAFWGNAVEAKQAWIQDRVKAEKSLSKKDFVSARAQLASSLTRVSKLPPAKDPKNIKLDILALNRDFANLWALETTDVMAKAATGGNPAIKEEY